MSSDYVTDTRTLLQAISTTDFLSALIINSGLSNIQSVTYNLKAAAKDIVEAVEEITTACYQSHRQYAY